MIDSLFSVYKQYSNGGIVRLMSGLSKVSPDYRDIISIACSLAREGHKVHVLASVHYKDPLYRIVYGTLIGTQYYRKCPDLLVDGVFYEYESYVRPFRSNKISHMLKRGAEQARHIIIDNNKGASDRFIVNMIVKRLNDKHFKGEIETVYVYEKGHIRQIFKKKAVGSFTSPRSTNP